MTRSEICAVRAVWHDETTHLKLRFRRDKALKVRDSYSGKLDSMRDDRDSWRSRYNDGRKK